MGRMPPKSGQVKGSVTSSPPVSSGPSTRRVTRSSPSKLNKSPPPSIRKRGQGGKGSPQEAPPSLKKRGQAAEESNEKAKRNLEGEATTRRPQQQPSSSSKQDKELKSPKTEDKLPVQQESFKEDDEEDEEEEDTSTEDEMENDVAPQPDKQNEKKPVTKKTGQMARAKPEHLSGSEVDEQPSTVKISNVEAETEKLLNEGRNVLAVMTTEEVNELLERIDSQCSPLDKVHVKTRENSLDWNKVSFSSYGPRQCQIAWVFLRQQSRKIRILSEVVSEIKLKFTTSKTFQTKLVESMPGFPQKPPNCMGGFQFFNRQEWDNYKTNKPPEEDLPNFVKYQRECKEKYNSLSKAEKTKYDNLAQLSLAEYKRKVKQFYAQNPGLAQLTKRLREEALLKKSRLKIERVKDETGGKSKRSASKPRAPRSETRDLNLPDPYEDAPQPPQSAVVLFIQSKLNRLDSPPTSEELPELKKKLFEKFNKLPEEKRLNWIDYCINSCIEYTLSVEEYKKEHPEYCEPKKIKINHIISKEEMSLWEVANGRPPNPKLSVSDVFYEEYFASDEDAHLPEAERKQRAVAKWEKMDWYHKEMYKMKYKISIVEFKRNIQTFFSSLPEILKPACLPRVPKKFLKMIEEVDKVPAETATPCQESEVEGKGKNEYGHGGEGDDILQRERQDSESQEEEPPRKKKKKDKKKKKRQDLEMDEEQAEEHPGMKYDEDQYQYPMPEEMGDETEVDEYYERKKKKKKKKHREEDYEEEPETITGDVYSDSQSEGPNHVSDSLGPHSIERRGDPSPLFRHSPTEEDVLKLRMSKKYKEDAKVRRSVNAELEMLRASGSKPLQVVKDTFVKKFKPSSKAFPSINTFVQNDIFEAVRGIFDGRAHLGRKYSVYYYYAKYVSRDKMWIDCVNTKGLETAALEILETFVSLNNHQKETFIDQSFRFYFDKVHGTKVLAKEDIPINSNSVVLFPGEPKPPPKRANQLYVLEMERKRRRINNKSFDFPPWENLDERLQTYYIKKLYHETSIYLRRFDQFFTSMTPNDLIEYTVHRANIWEHQLYTKQSLIWAARDFVFPFPTKEFHETGQDPEPEMLYQNTLTPASMLAKKSRSRSNPFAKSIQLNNLIRKMPRKGRRKRKNKNSESDDNPSSDDQKGFSLYNINSRMKKKIRKAAKYMYPMEDVFTNFNDPEHSQDTKKCKNSQTTQTESYPTKVPHKSRGTQTHLGGLDVIISEHRLTKTPQPQTNLAPVPLQKIPKILKNVKHPVQDNSSAGKGSGKANAPLRKPRNAKIVTAATSRFQNIACSVIVPDRKQKGTLSVLKQKIGKAPKVAGGTTKGSKTKLKDTLPLEVGGSTPVFVDAPLTYDLPTNRVSVEIQESVATDSDITVVEFLNSPTLDHQNKDENSVPFNDRLANVNEKVCDTALCLDPSIPSSSFTYDIMPSPLEPVAEFEFTDKEESELCEDNFHLMQPAESTDMTDFTLL